MEIPGVVLPEAHGWNNVPLKPFDILICLFPNLPPSTPDHGTLASGLWVLLWRGCFFSNIQHSWDSQVLTHHSPGPPVEGFLASSISKVGYLGSKE